MKLLIAILVPALADAAYCSDFNSWTCSRWRSWGYCNRYSSVRNSYCRRSCNNCPRPTRRPTRFPTRFPTQWPTRFPTNFPTRYPTRFPTRYPTRYPTRFPTRYPTRYPTRRPTNYPTRRPTSFPTRSCQAHEYRVAATDTCVTCQNCAVGKFRFECGGDSAGTCEPCTPTIANAHHTTWGKIHNVANSCDWACDAGYTGFGGTPGRPASCVMTKAPTQSPTQSPTASPTQSPTASPTQSPTESPTASPTQSPTESPTQSPTQSPTESPTQSPTESPTPKCHKMNCMNWNCADWCECYDEADEATYASIPGCQDDGDDSCVCFQEQGKPWEEGDAHMKQVFDDIFRSNDRHDKIHYRQYQRRRVVCGRHNPHECTEHDKWETDGEAMHEVRCCADGKPSPAVPGMKHCANPSSPGPQPAQGWKGVLQSDNIWGMSKIGLSGDKCVHAATFDEAKALCALIPNGRLCTENELKNECTSYTGCGHDYDLIWVKPQMVGVDTRTGVETSLAEKPF